MIPPRRPLLLLLAALLAGCASPADWSAGAPGDPAERARIAEAELRRVGEGRFEVDAFEPLGESKLTFRDFYDYPSHVFALRFKARTHCTHDFEVFSRDQLMHRQGRPGFTIADFERDAQLLALFGEGEMIPGQKLPIEASASFDALEPGFRFRLFDRPRESRP